MPVTPSLSEQEDFSDFSPSSGGAALVPRGVTFGESKKAKAVNRLLAQVDRLRDELERERRRLDDALIVHAAQIAPRQQRVTELRTAFVCRIAPFLDDSRVSKADKRTLRDLLIEQVDEILARVQTPDPAIRALFERLHGMGFDEAVQSGLADVRSEMEEFFDSIGLDMDVPDLRPDMSDEEAAATAARMFERLQAAREEHAAREAQRPKSKRELREEQRAAERAARHERARKISIGAIYTRLVKALHPDLEQDPAARERKSAVMQQVTTAYGANDLPTLLRLELQWVDGAGADASRQTDETLDAYAAQLRAQASELRATMFELAAHPRYAVLTDARDPFARFRRVDLAGEVERLDTAIAALAAGLSRLEDDRQGLREVRDLLKLHRRAQRASNPF